MGHTVRHRHHNESVDNKPTSNPTSNRNQQGCSSKGRPKKIEYLPQSIWVLIIALFYGTIITIVYRANNQLPQPKNKLQAKPVDFIEENAKDHVKKFVGFGPRPAGSIANEVDVVNYILACVSDIQSTLHPSMKLEVEIQRPTGSFTIDFIGGFASYYTNITNTIVRLSPSGGISDHTLLLNCHTDSVNGVPGASDDAVACAVLLEVLRAIVTDHQRPLLHNVIFLFNGAEENILQASHGFVTQHRWAKEVKAFINLEAAGAGGKEVVFQTGPSNPWLALTWAKHAPYPFGTVFGQEIFQSGIIPSDTDFRIFRDFGKIPGIDLAYMKNGYVYHTIYDKLEMITPGCIQRAGDNILSVVSHLVKAKTSLLPNPSTYRHGSLAYVDILGMYMITIPIELLSILNMLCSVGALIYIGRRVVFSSDSSSEFYGKQIIKAAGTIILTWVFCIITVSMIAAFITLFGNSMSFYSKPYLVAFLYAFPGLIAMIGVHCVANRFIFKIDNPWKLEEIFFDAYLFIWSVFLFQLNYLQLQSSIILLLCSAPVLIMRCLFLKNIFDYNNSTNITRKVVVYLLCLTPHSILVFSHTLLILELFIPLCGRLGHDVPPDLVIGIITSVSACFAGHFVLSLVHVAKKLRWILSSLLLCTLVAVTIALSSHGFPYSGDPISPTPKRLYLQHSSREFYDYNKDLQHSDSGLWINFLDYPSFSVDIGVENLSKVSAMPCEGLFCHFPFLLPVQKFIKSSKYVPARKPLSNDMRRHPFYVHKKNEQVTLISENATTRVYKKRISFRVVGPDHMSIQIAPLSSRGVSTKLSSWSIEGDLDDAWTEPTSLPADSNNFLYTTWFFIYYGSGLTAEPWEPWFEFIVVQDAGLRKPHSDTDGSRPTAEISFSAQYFSDDRHIPVAPQTQQIKEFLSELHDWVMPIPWVSLYKNYLY